MFTSWLISEDPHQILSQGKILIENHCYGIVKTTWNLIETMYLQKNKTAWELVLKENMGQGLFDLKFWMLVNLLTQFINSYIT